MSRTGSHQLIDAAHLRRMRALSSDTERVAYADTVLNYLYERSEGTDYDKAWALLHSALQRSSPCSDYLARERHGPSSWAILGTEDIALTDECLITAMGRWPVLWVERYLRSLTSEDIRERLVSLMDENDCAGMSREDADYAAGWFPRLQDFYRRAARRFSPVIFVGDLC